MTAEWLSAREAAARLDVKLATLYAYASRGLIESVARAEGPGRVYARASVERLKARHDARAGHTAVAAGALRWGEPSVETSISEIRADGPAYRGHGVLALCRSAPSFESVAMLLWTGTLGEPRWSAPKLRVSLPRRPAETNPIAYLTAAVAMAALRDDGRHGSSDAREHQRAQSVISWLAQSREGSIAERLVHGFGVRPTKRAVHAVDRALILCADHELNPSTFAVRVTASTGADLYACLCTGLATLSGPKHGGMTSRVEALLREIRQPARASLVMLERLARGETIAGFGHPLYADGDPRARALLALAGAKQGVMMALVRAMQSAGQPPPNLDAGLVALCHALGLPDGAAALLFTIGRIAGWTAHALEQRAQGYLMRPRARYVAQSS